jgi:hypothetical protein
VPLPERIVNRIIVVVVVVLISRRAHALVLTRLTASGD